MEEIFQRVSVKKKKKMESISQATGACIHKSDKSQPEAGEQSGEDRAAGTRPNHDTQTQSLTKAIARVWIGRQLAV